MDCQSRNPLRAVLAVVSLAFAVLTVRADGGAGPPHNPSGTNAGGWQSVQKLLDISGLAWLGGDTFLAVHDAKVPDEKERIRTSLLRLPDSLDGIQWLPLRTHFPDRPSSDLESAARIPGTQDVLLLESGDDDSGLDRIYLARVERRDIRILDAIRWSSFTPIFNVEGSAVAVTDDGYLFIWAERADGETQTLVQWTELNLTPFAIGASGVIGSALFTLPDDLAAAYNRPLVGIDVDGSGRICAIAAFDPDADGGPFRSAVMAIGRVEDGEVVLDPVPTVLGVLDGLKVESVAIRGNGEHRDLVVGTDDEYYGGTLRLLPFRP